MYLSRQRYLLVKVKDGLISGLKTLYYTWSGENPPDELLNLKPVKEGISPNINYIWWDGPAPGLPSEFYAVAWIGYIEVDKPGLYRFYLTTDDGSRLWIDDKLLIDAWRDQAPTTYVSEPIYLSRGYHKLKYYYYNRYGLGEAVLGWIPPDGEPTIIPHNRFFHCIGSEVFFTNIPDNYVVEVKPIGGEKKACVASGSLCVIKYSLDDYPLEAVIRIYDEASKPIYEAESPILVWGGDEFKLVVLKELDDLGSNRSHYS